MLGDVGLLSHYQIKPTNKLTSVKNLYSLPTVEILFQLACGSPLDSSMGTFVVWCRPKRAWLPGACARASGLGCILTWTAERVLRCVENSGWWLVVVGGWSGWLVVLSIAAGTSLDVSSDIFRTLQGALLSGALRSARLLAVSETKQ